MEIVAVNGQMRTETGKRSTKAVRNAGLIPCVLYGGKDAIHFSVDPKEVKSLIYTPDFKSANIIIDGAENQCIVRDIQFHPVTDEIRHIDFLRLIEGNPVKVEVPIRFEGTAVGEKEGGSLQESFRKVKIKVTPENLVDSISVNISGLKLGQSIRVRDLEVDESIELLTPMGTPLAGVQIPRALRSAEAEEAEAAELEAAEAALAAEEAGEGGEGDAPEAPAPE